MPIPLPTRVRVVAADLQERLAVVRDVRPVRVPDFLAVLGKVRLDTPHEPVELLRKEVRPLAPPVRTHVAAGRDRVRLLVHLDEVREPVFLGHPVVVDERDDLSRR